MKIPAIVKRDNKEYSFIQKCNDNVFLYIDKETDTRKCFSKYDLGMIDNKRIDKFLNIKTDNKQVKVYDRLTEEEEIYENIYEVSRQLNYTAGTILNRINVKKWLNKRYFIEYVEEEV